MVEYGIFCWQLWRCVDAFVVIVVVVVVVTA
jgi:hypothetical protein